MIKVTIKVRKYTALSFNDRSYYVDTDDQHVAHDLALDKLDEDIGIKVADLPTPKEEALRYYTGGVIFEKIELLVKYKK